MISTRHLTESNIFTIPLQSNKDDSSLDINVIYSPFTDEAFLATTDFVSKMESHISNQEDASGDIKELMNSLLDESRRIKLAPRLESTDGYTKMAILPNNVCNFHCSYCYSAAGRNNQVIDKKVLKTALEHFVDPTRISKDTQLSISFLGGGEPLLSFDLLKFAVEYSSELAQKFGFKRIAHNVVTNGSILNEEILYFLIEHKISVSVSFEILQEIQELQRGNYPKVKSNIQKLLFNNIQPQLRATITKDNVMMLKQMVEEVASCYKGVKEVMMEYVTDEDSFESISDIRKFLTDYVDQFFIAKKYGEERGIKVDCSALRNYELLIERFCPGEYSITPAGEISICSRITSPLNNGYDDCIYGRFLPTGSSEVNNEKFKKLIDNNVYQQDKCKNCFAKWHCGGGCLAQTYEYNEEILNEMCEFTRNFTKRLILEEIERDIIEQHNKTLSEFLESI